MDNNLNHVEDSQDYEIAYVFFGETNNKKLGRSSEDGENTIIGGYNISDIMTDKDAQAVIDSSAKIVKVEYKDGHLFRDGVIAKEVIRVKDKDGKVNKKLINKEVDHNRVQRYLKARRRMIEGKNER